MTSEDKKILAQEIEKDYARFCGDYDDWCTNCPYSTSGLHCEFQFALSYLDKRHWLKEHK